MTTQEPPNHASHTVPRHLNIGELRENLGPKAYYLHDKLLATDNSSVLDNFTAPATLGSFAIVCCESGTLDCAINMKDYRLKADSMMLLLPNDTFQVVRQQDCRIIAILISASYVRELQLHFFHYPAINMERVPVVTVPDSACIHFPHTVAARSSIACEARIFHAMLAHYLTMTDEMAGDIIRPLIAVIFYSAINLFQRLASGKDLKLHSEYAAHSARLLERFLALLSAHQHEQRTVQFYASQMKLSPNYMSGAIKAFTGRTALEWINDYVILEAKRQLRYTEKSVNEISAALNFPSQSAFGKYFKQQTGLSPLAYRHNN